jgi:hypothetical protein
MRSTQAGRIDPVPGFCVSLELSVLAGTPKDPKDLHLYDEATGYGVKVDPVFHFPTRHFPLT